MKKLVLLSLAFVAMISCNKVAVETMEAPEASRAFNISVRTLLTKSALVTGTELPAGSKIGVALFDVDKTYDNLSYYNLEYTATGSGAEQTWGTTTVPGLSATLGTVYAYYPYAVEVTDFKSIAVSATTENQVDYMWANPVNGICGSQPDVDLTMNHALAAVRVLIERGSYTGVGQVTSISVKGAGLGTTAVLDASSGTLSEINGTNTAISPAIDAYNITAEAKGNEIIVVPTNAAAITFEIVMDGVTYELSTGESAIETKAGQINEFTITANATGMNITKVTVTEWTVKQESDIEMGGNNIKS